MPSETSSFQQQNSAENLEAPCHLNLDRTWRELQLKAAPCRRSAHWRAGRCRGLPLLQARAGRRRPPLCPAARGKPSRTVDHGGRGRWVGQMLQFLTGNLCSFLHGRHHSILLLAPCGRGEPAPACATRGEDEEGRPEDAPTNDPDHAPACCCCGGGADVNSWRPKLEPPPGGVAERNGGGSERGEASGGAMRLEQQHPPDLLGVLGAVPPELSMASTPARCSDGQLSALRWRSAMAKRN
ncbi:unnamed protein product [Urochloa humidicola]